MSTANGRMRIGFLVLKNPRLGGGIESYTYEVGKRLAARGHHVVVYSMSHYGKVPAMLEGMRVMRVPSMRGAAGERLSASAYAVLLASFQRPQFNVLHLHTPMTGAMGIVARFVGIPTVVQMHGVDWKRSRWGFLGRNVIRGLEKFVMRCMPMCTAVSQTQCDFYEKEYGRILKMIPPGAKCPELTQASDEIEKIGLRPDKYILFMSRFVREKGAHWLIGAFRNLKTDHRLVMAGGDLAVGKYGEELRKISGGDPRILFPGFVQGKLKEQLLSHASIYVQPSEIEGLSIALIDAMGYGLPCLVSNIPENVEAIGNAGMTFESKNTKDLRLKLEELLANKTLRASLGAAARCRAAQEYSWDRVTDALEQLYDRASKTG